MNEFRTFSRKGNRIASALPYFQRSRSLPKPAFVSAFEPLPYLNFCVSDGGIIIECSTSANLALSRTLSLLGKALIPNGIRAFLCLVSLAKLNSMTSYFVFGVALALNSCFTSRNADLASLVETTGNDGRCAAVVAKSLIVWLALVLQVLASGANMSRAIAGFQKMQFGNPT